MVLKVVELFAGVGGFRILEGPPDTEDTTSAVIWSKYNDGTVIGKSTTCK